MEKKDYILIAVLYGSLLVGIFFPGPSAAVSGTIKYLMMTMLFLAFIKVSPADVGRALLSNWVGMIWGTLLRLVVAPAVAYWVTLASYPPLALPILLLAGASTGVSSPFFTSLCRGNISYCLVMAVVTTLILPISLPAMVKVLAHATLDYDLTAMALFLAMIIFVPLGVAFVFRTLAPGMLGVVNRMSYPISLVVVAGINFGALGRYVPYLKTNPEEILYCAVYSIGLALVLALLGWSSTRTRNWADRVAASGSQVWINNILIIALAVYMNQPLAATLSVFYLIPFYGFVVFFSVLANRVEPAFVPGEKLYFLPSGSPCPTPANKRKEKEKGKIKRKTP
jgi:BASS family bile acid:Na+ symporter